MNNIIIDGVEYELKLKQKSKDWEIVSFSHHAMREKFMLIENGLYACSRWPDEYFNIDDLLHNKIGETYNIHSVRRISTNEVFSVGDFFFVSPGYNRHTIKRFVINAGAIAAIDDILYYLPHLMKKSEIKPILFTTEDGIPIYEGDEYWYISLYLNNLDKVNKAIAIHIGSTLKNFSTKEAAEEYILMNKPYLSLMDVRKWIEKCSDYPNGASINQLVSIVKGKLKAI